MASAEPKLAVEMIPEPLWQINARRVLTQGEWDTMRRHAYKKAEYHCEVCGGRGHLHPVEAHEVWRYDDELHVQTLERLVALCPDCHTAVHYGRAEVVGKALDAQRQLKAVNGWSEPQLQEHLEQAWDTWQERSRYPNWEVDFTWLVETYRDLTGKIPTFFQEDPA